MSRKGCSGAELWDNDQGLGSRAVWRRGTVCGGKAGS
jgi:hypothetical protein